MKGILLVAVLIAGGAPPPSPASPTLRVTKTVAGLDFWIEKGPGDDRTLVISIPPGTKGPIAVGGLWVRTIGKETDWQQNSEDRGKSVCGKWAVGGYPYVRTIHRQRPLRVSFVRRSGDLSIQGILNFRERVRKAFQRRGVAIWSDRATFAQSEVP